MSSRRKGKPRVQPPKPARTAPPGPAAPKSSAAAPPRARSAPRSSWTRIAKAAALPVAVVIVLLVIGFSRGGGGGSASGTGTTALWGTGVAGLSGRLQALGLPGSDGGAIHIHQHLDVYVKGRHAVVPAEIGLTSSFGAPLHTHDTSGVIHLESPIVRPYTLGDFFGIWNVRLTRTCLGSYCNRGAARLRVYVDGDQFSGNAASIVLTAREEIAVTYGTPAQLPKPIPASYSFAAGL